MFWFFELAALHTLISRLNDWISSSYLSGLPPFGFGGDHSWLAVQKCPERPRFVSQKIFLFLRFHIDPRGARLASGHA
jgi:hypothetical protein